MHQSGLNVREIFHRHFGICQLVYFAGTRSWVGLNEQKQSLTAPDRNGYPELDKLKRAAFLYREQLPYLEILNSHYQPDVMLLPLRPEREEAPA